MRASTMPGEKRHFHMARRAVSVFFFLNGAMTAALSARLPVLQTKLALSPDHLGLALLGCTIGGLAAANVAARLSRRFGSKLITIIAGICMGVALVSIAFAPTFPTLILALVFFGVGGGALDLTTNIQGADVERGYGRPMLNAFYAYFSVGSLVSALLGSALAAFNVSPVFHFLALALGAGVGIGWSAPFLLPRQPGPAASKEQTPGARALHFSRPLILLGVIAFCALLSVGAMFDWSAVYLSKVLHTGDGLAAAGFAAFLCCLTLGRGVGDSLVARFGSVAVVRAACLLAAIGLALALLFAWTPVALCGLGLVGLGLSVPFPLALRAAGRLSERETESILAIVTTWGYGAILAGAPVIGFVAGRVGLRLALVFIVFLCLLAALCAPGMRVSRGNEEESHLQGR